MCDHVTGRRAQPLPFPLKTLTLEQGWKAYPLFTLEVHKGLPKGSGQLQYCAVLTYYILISNSF